MNKFQAECDEFYVNVNLNTEMELPTSRDGLQAFRIASLPPEFYYIPNFITAEEEASILGKVRSLPLILPCVSPSFFFLKKYPFCLFSHLPRISTPPSYPPT